MLKLDEDEVKRRRLADYHGQQSTSEITAEVAREQVVDALRNMDCNTYNDPQVERLVEILRFAFEHGVL